MNKIAYKIENKDIWYEAMNNGIYHGSSLDIKDGFIHLSLLNQLSKTLELHFEGQKNLIIAAINIADAGINLKWEQSRGGELFPHIYGSLANNDIVKTFMLFDNTNENRENLIKEISSSEE